MFIKNAVGEVKRQTKTDFKMRIELLTNEHFFYLVIVFYNLIAKT